MFPLMASILVKNFYGIIILQEISLGAVRGVQFNLVAHLRLTHSSPSSDSCDKINTDIGVMYWVAIDYAIRKINKERLLFNNTLTLSPADTCTGKIMPPYKTVTHNGFAVIGPYSSESAEFTTKFLSLFRITTISYAATATGLSDRREYPHFFRTVPSDDYPAQIFYELAVRFQWYYVAILYSDCIEGRSMKSALEDRFDDKFCIRLSEPIAHHDSNDTLYFDLLTNILQLKIRVVYLFLRIDDCHRFFFATESFRWKLEHLTFILGTNCGTLINNNNASSLRRSYLFNRVITVGITNPVPREFAEYFESLNPGEAKSKFSRILSYYFGFYWWTVYGCKSVNHTSSCYMQPNTKYNHLAPVRPVIEAVYAAAYSIRRAIIKRCQGKNISCYDIASEDKNNLREKLNKFMLPGIGESEVYPRITEDGGVTSDFSIYQYQSDRGDRNGFVKIGHWNYSAYQLHGSGLSLPGMFELPNSTCSVECAEHHIIVHQDACPLVCWKCKKCDSTMIMTNNTCVECQLGYKANINRSECFKLPLKKSINPNNVVSIVIIAFSTISLIASFIILFVYLHNFDTPIIKATSRELALFSLGGLILMLITPMIIVVGPSTVICSMQKIMFGLSLTCSYAPLMLKTNRIYRIFMSSQKFKLKKLTLVSTSSLMLLITGMIGVQLVMGVFWIMTDIPITLVSYPDNELYAVVQCNITAVPGSLNIIFPIALMIASTFWAFKTRNLPQEFSEIKSIGVTMYITLFSGTCALAFLALLKQRSLSMNYYIICFTFQLVAVVTLIGQYAMKVKILYWDRIGEDNAPKPDCTMTGFAAVIANPSLVNSPNLSNLSIEEEINGLDSNARRGTATSANIVTSLVSNRRLASPKLKRYSIDLK